jgi:50S ribosomal protein L16 3-hydroxylase
MELLLQRLLTDMPVARFLDAHYLRSPLVRRAAAASLQRLATWEKVERLVEATACDVLVVRDGAPWPGGRPSSAHEARELAAQGYTLALRQPDRHDAELAELGRALARELQGTINLHVYATPAGRGGFGWHFDPEEVFIFQVAGAKQYLYRENTLQPAPLEETMGQLPDPARERSPVHECQLEAGDWLYLPGGQWHLARAAGDAPALSISVGLMPATPLHVLDFLRTQLVRDPAWRQRLPALGLASPLTDAQKLEAMRELCRQLGAQLERALAEPTFTLRFLAAWARAGARSSSLGAPPPGGRGA